MKDNKPLEIEIELEFTSKVKALGCMCFKLEIKGRKGATDRLVVIPGGKVLFIEFKRPGKLHNTSPHQIVFMRELRNINHEALVTDSYKQALEKVIKILTATDL